MKKLLTLIATALTINAHSQCQMAPCTNVITFPISTIDFNNGSGIYAGYGANRCIEGQGTFGQNLNIPGNANWWSFNGTGTGIDITQTLNLNTGKRGYLQGVNNIHHLHMAGGTDSAIIYCADNSYTTCTVDQANNSNNYIYLGNGASFFIGGSLYQAGDTYQGQGNTTNVIHFVSCPINTPLEITFEYFYYKNKWLYWKANNNEGLKVHRIYSGDNGETWTTECQPRELTDSMLVVSEGLYKMVIGNKESKIIPVSWEQIETPEPKRVTLYKIKTPDGLYNATKIVR